MAKFLNSKSYSQQSEASIALLSILNNIDSNQWKQVFYPNQTQKMINFMYQAKNPPLLKAACIK